MTCRDFCFFCLYDGYSCIIFSLFLKKDNSTLNFIIQYIRKSDTLLNVLWQFLIKWHIAWIKLRKSYVFLLHILSQALLFFSLPLLKRRNEVDSYSATVNYRQLAKASSGDYSKHACVWQASLCSLIASLLSYTINMKMTMQKKVATKLVFP